MKNRNGFTLVEVMIVIAILSILATVVFDAILNNRGATERRAFESANIFLAENNITTERMTCAGDSDNDGYGTCNIVTDSGEKILLNCPTNYFDINWWGANNCKEVLFNINMMQ